MIIHDNKAAALAHTPRRAARYLCALMAPLFAAACMMPVDVESDDGESPVALETQELTGGGGEWAWVKYTATGNVRYRAGSSNAGNGTGQDVVVWRTSRGSYEVHFEDLGFSGLKGDVQVSSFRSGNTRCTASSFKVIGTDQVVYVRCLDPDGRTKDARFIAQYQKRGDTYARNGFVEGHGSSESNPDNSFNSRGKQNSINRTSLGRFTVRFRGLSSPGGNAQVTALSHQGHFCNIKSIYNDGEDKKVDVRCYNRVGGLANIPFVLRFEQEGQTFYLGAHTIATDATSPFYAPLEKWTWSKRWPTDGERFGCPGRTLVGRTALGKYGVGFSDQFASRSSAVVSGFGTSAEYCNIADITQNDVPMKEEVWMQVKVACWKPDGSPADNTFSLSATSNFWTANYVCSEP